MLPKGIQISSMNCGCFRGESSGAVIYTASCSDPTGLLERNSQLRCGIASDRRVTGEGSLAIVEMSGEGVYIVLAAVVAAGEVAALVVTVVVVATVVAVTKLVPVVVVVRDASISMASLSAAAMTWIDVNVMLVVGHWLLLGWRYWVESSVCRVR